ncbi:unnamed protein product [Orchesella dallaii]|uniref:Peptidase S1 domain-containing protein n=1 Tax=Orchesella dallaii TaxID=48710 RepID=A0ABP1RPQ9_9HEXA
MAAHSDGMRFCGGTLIDWDLVLTSASCVFDPRFAILVTAGDHSIYQQDGTEQTQYSKQIILHENFNTSGKLENDIALVQLERKLKTTAAVRPITLVPASFEIDNATYGIIAGWGQTEIPPTTSTTATTEGARQLSGNLKTAKVPTLNGTACGSLASVEVMEGEFCTADVNGGLEGDRGGPLICSNALCCVCGILSRVVTIENEEEPTQIVGVFVKVSDYLKWIEDQIPQEPSSTTAASTTTPTQSTTTPASASSLFSSSIVIISMISLIL